MILFWFLPKYKGYKVNIWEVINLIAFNSQAYYFLEIVAISGESPLSNIDLILGNGRYKEKVITELKQEHMIKTYYKDKLKSYRLTSKGKKYLIDLNKKRFEFYLQGNSETNKNKTELTRRKRLHCISEAYSMMKQAQVEIFKDKKADIFTLEYNPRQPPKIQDPSFYSSREIKGIGIQAVKVKNTRAVGVLITENQVYIIYNTQENIMKWQYKSEMRLKAVISYCLMERKILKNCNIESINAVMIGSSMDIAYNLITSNGGYKKQLFMLDESFKSIYFVPRDTYGITMLKILSNDNLRQKICNILSIDLIIKSSYEGIDCDAYNSKNQPVLFAFDFDMVRIVRFQSAVNLREIKGSIICFDFQKDVLNRYCNSRIDIQTIDYKKFERRFFSE